MEIVYRSLDAAETDRLAGNLVAAGLHPVTERQERMTRWRGTYLEWCIWLPAEELSLAKPVLREWEQAHDAKIKLDLQEIHRLVSIAGVLGLVILAVSWLLVPKIFSERWGEFVAFAFILAGGIAIVWNEWQRRKR